MDAPDRRRFSRIPFHAGVELHVERGTAPARLLDIGLKGALVEVGEGLEVERGDPCALALRLEGGEVVIRMDGAIAHREGTRLGVRWYAIDLESIAHLRRLVELNVGSDVQGELAALVGGA
ncbi:PilZ domain-containing protein [Anaeromyxobacter terrae]|uniref:PilZ domain-containing protein n=1 Tax=Anaeromyxobacter terrae TaxID=2925406 RepID=UPI001F568841|nr:PilZ domain-containing protein [Anaeromyxobacter sp. SG22]